MTIKVSGSSLTREKNEEDMMERFHGLDRHKSHSTICVLNKEGKEVEFHNKCEDLKTYVEGLGVEDTVVLESGTGCFYWADRIEEQGACCYIIDPHKFKIIKDSWNKTDKQDSRNMAKALWAFKSTGEFGLPEVYKPSVLIRELRKFFSQYQMLNRQIRIAKNSMQANLLDNGVVLSKLEKRHLFSTKRSQFVLESRQMSRASRMCIQMSLGVFWQLEEQKKMLSEEILCAGEPLKDQVRLLMSIKGISALGALAFLADVADVRRFSSTRKMNAYLGVVPRCKESGGKSRNGHINRESRKLTRSILTQSITHIASASPYFHNFYQGLKSQKGAGKARIALIRKLCAVMRRMLLNGEEFRSTKIVNYEKKLKDYSKALEKMRGQKKTA